MNLRAVLELAKRELGLFSKPNRNLVVGRPSCRHRREQKGRREREAGEVKPRPRSGNFACTKMAAPRMRDTSTSHTNEYIILVSTPSVRRRRNVKTETSLRSSVKLIQTVEKVQFCIWNT